MKLRQDILKIWNILKFAKREDRIIESLVNYFQVKVGMHGVVKLSEIFSLKEKTYKAILKDIVICDTELGNNKELKNLFNQIDKSFPITIAVGQKVKAIKGHGFLGFNKKGIPIYIGGRLTNIADYKGRKKKVCAIVSTYEDEDIVENVCTYLLNQGLYVHIIDNWSKDKTYDIVGKLSKENHKLTYERFPSSPEKEYLWSKILKRKEEFAKESNYDWYIHYDSDEIRESCWQYYSLLEGVSFVDSLGFNSIDHTVLDFRPINDLFKKGNSLKDTIKYFEFGKRAGHFLQRKIWKASSDVDLVSSGGHVAEIPNQKVFPFKFLLRHYPLRNLRQMHKKIFQDRLPRVKKEKREFGWHVQYDKFIKKEKKLSLWSPKNLYEFDDNFYEDYILERLTGLEIPLER